MHDNNTQAPYILCIMTCVAARNCASSSFQTTSGDGTGLHVQYAACFSLSFFVCLFRFLFFSFFFALTHCFWLADPTRNIDKMVWPNCQFYKIYKSRISAINHTQFCSREFPCKSVRLVVIVQIRLKPGKVAIMPRSWYTRFQSRA